MDRFVWELAGILGIHPGPFTLRELLIMAEARSQQRWNHTASLLAMLANSHRDPRKSRIFVPDDFHPHRQRRESPPVKVGISVLKQVFVDQPAFPGG